jgi:hypothetical protein
VEGRAAGATDMVGAAKEAVATAGVVMEKVEVERVEETE